MKAPNAIVNSWPQRLVVLGAVLAVVLGFTMIPDGTRSADVAHARYQCGPNNSNRAQLETAGGETLRPCVTGTNLQVEVPVNGTEKRVEINGVQRDPGVTLENLACIEDRILGILEPLTGSLEDILGQLGLSPEELVDEAFDVCASGDLHTVKYADGSTEQLYRLTFRDLTFVDDVTLVTNNNNVAGERSDDGSGVPARGSPLKIRPDVITGRADAELGRRTDLWVTPESVIYLDISSVTEIEDPVVQPLLGQLTGVECDQPTRVDDPLLGLTGVVPLDVKVCGVDLEVRFLTTSTRAGDTSVKLPTTTISLEGAGSARSTTMRRGSDPSGSMDAEAFLRGLLSGRPRSAEEQSDSDRPPEQQQPPGAQTFSPNQPPEADETPSGDGGPATPGTSEGTSSGGGSTDGGSTDGGSTDGGSGGGDSGSEDCGFSLFGSGC